MAMKTTRIIPDLASAQQAIRQSLQRSDYDRLTTHRPSRVYFDLALDWIGILLAVVAVSLLPTWWMNGLAFIVVGSCQYALFILGHDALHGSLHPRRIINDRLAKWLIYGPMFMGLEDARRNHLEHHRRLGTKSDPDRYLHSLDNKNTKIKFLLFCTGLATFAKTVVKVTPMGKLLSQQPQPVVPSSSKVVDDSLAKTLIAYCRQRYPVMVMQPLLLMLFVLLGLPLFSYFILWVAPIYVCVFLPDEIRAFCEHAVIQPLDELADSHRLITFCPTRLEAIIFSPHNMNYHAEHHLWPAIPYFSLPKAHQFVKGRSEVTVRGSYVDFLYKVCQFLPLESHSVVTSGSHHRE